MNIFDVFNGPQRRLHVYDNVDAPQFRISQTYNIDPALGVWADFKTDASGNLTIIPTGDKVGIGLLATAPQQTLDVFRTARIRSMSVNNLQSEIVVRNPANGDLFLNTSIASNANNAWYILGNTGTNSTSNFLGTSDDVDLVLRTNNVERARIIGNPNIISGIYEGNVGIGLTNPTAKLHVEYPFALNLNPTTVGLFQLRNT